MPTPWQDRKIATDQTGKPGARSVGRSVAGFIKLPSTVSLSPMSQAYEIDSGGQWQGLDSLSDDDASRIWQGF